MGAGKGCSPSLRAPRSISTPGGFHRHRRHRIGLGARRIEGTGVRQARDTDLPLDLGVIGLEFLIADRPIRERRCPGMPPSTLRSLKSISWKRQKLAV